MKTLNKIHFIKGRTETPKGKSSIEGLHTFGSVRAAFYAMVGEPMKRLLVIVLLLASARADAYDTSKNPDQCPSVGLDISSGKLPGILKDVTPNAPATDGGFVRGILDLRLPVSNALTIHAFGSSTGVNNNLQFSGGNEVGFGLRVYLR